jgi:hypothetical protein
MVTRAPGDHCRATRAASAASSSRRAGAASPRRLHQGVRRLDPGAPPPGAHPHARPHDSTARRAPPPARAHARTRPCRAATESRTSLAGDDESAARRGPRAHQADEAMPARGRASASRAARGRRRRPRRAGRGRGHRGAPRARPPSVSATSSRATSSRLAPFCGPQTADAPGTARAAGCPTSGGGDQLDAGQPRVELAGQPVELTERRRRRERAARRTRRRAAGESPPAAAPPSLVALPPSRTTWHKFAPASSAASSS